MPQDLDFGVLELPGAGMALPHRDGQGWSCQAQWHLVTSMSSKRLDTSLPWLSRCISTMGS